MNRKSLYYLILGLLFFLSVFNLVLVNLYLNNYTVYVVPNDQNSIQFLDIDGGEEKIHLVYLEAQLIVENRIYVHFNIFGELQLEIVDPQNEMIYSSNHSSGAVENQYYVEDLKIKTEGDWKFVITNYSERSGGYSLDIRSINHIYNSTALIILTIQFILCILYLVFFPNELYSQSGKLFQNIAFGVLIGISMITLLTDTSLDPAFSLLPIFIVMLFIIIGIMTQNKVEDVDDNIHKNAFRSMFGLILISICMPFVIYHTCTLGLYCYLFLGLSILLIIISPLSYFIIRAYLKTLYIHRKL
ncbi:MAG: hypothetical protein INQ03_05035 [Candidatus Heimdallarchaeota archaeon]|nr:hypothetical protein [Candidatus Heimdallarchaeota archaeon]